MGEIISEEQNKANNVHPSIAFSFGLGGNIKTSPRDFIVEEVWENHICRINYPIANRLVDQLMTRFQKRNSYLHFTLVKRALLPVWQARLYYSQLRSEIGLGLARIHRRVLTLLTDRILL